MRTSVTVLCVCGSDRALSLLPKLTSLLSYKGAFWGAFLKREISSQDTHWKHQAIYLKLLSKAIFSPADKEQKKLLRESTRPLGALHVGSTASPSVELLLDLKAELGEALTWDERTERLYFVDTNSKRIYSCTETGQDLFSILTPEPVGTIALTTDQNLLLAAMNRYEGYLRTWTV